MTSPEAPNHDLDELLDRVAGQLRQQPVSAMPAACRDWKPGAGLSQREGSPQGGLASRLAIAASVLLMLGTGGLAFRLAQHLDPGPAPTTEPPPIAKHADGSEIYVVDIPLEAGLDSIRAGLDAMDRDLAELRQQAALLDARRRAAELLNSMVSAER